MWPELGERHGWVEAGEDGDGVEFSGVPHELGLVVHSDNLAGVNLDKTPMNKWKASTTTFCQELKEYRSNLSWVDFHLNELPEQARVKLGQGSLWHNKVLTHSSHCQYTSTYLARAGELGWPAASQGEAEPVWSLLCGVGIVLWAKKLRLPTVIFVNGDAARNEDNRPQQQDKRLGGQIRK